MRMLRRCGVRERASRPAGALLLGGAILLAGFAAAMATAVPAAHASTAAAADRTITIPARIVQFTKAWPDDRCNTFVYATWSAVKGAKSYALVYYDTYYKHMETAAPDPTHNFISDRGQVIRRPGKNHFLIALTAGFGPCPNDSNRVGRFRKAHVVVVVSGNKPTLTVAVTVPRGGVSVGKSVDVTVRVSAGKVALTGVSLGSGLAGTGDVAEVTRRPLGLSGFSLGAGASKSFSFTVKALKAGAAALRARATANSQDGSVSGSGAATLRVAKSALALTMATSPKKVKLKVGADGKVVPAHVQVTVRLTNTGTSALKAVSLQSVNPEPVVRGQPLNQLRLPRGSLPVEVGTLAARSAVTRTFTLTVTGDGKYQLAGLALFDDNGATGRVVTVGGRFEATVPLLYFAPKQKKTNITVRNGASWVQGGKSWYVSGTIENESSYQPLCVAPLVPGLSGNAAATGMVDIEKVDQRKGGPFAGALEPGDSVALSMFVDTSAVGGTRSQLSLKPVAKLLPRGTKCTSQTVDKLKPVKRSDVTIPKPGGTFTVHVDTSAPLAAPSSGAKNTVEFFGGIAQNLFHDVCTDVLGIVAEARSLAANPALLTTPGLIDAARIRAEQLLYTATDVYANYWRLATQEEKSNLYYRAGNVLYRTGTSFWVATKGTVEDAAKPWMDQMQAAYAKGDDAKIWHLWGQATGAGVHQVVLMVFSEVLGAKLAESVPALEKAAATEGKAWETKTAQAIADEPATAKVPPEEARKTVPPGEPLNPVVGGRVWGIDQPSDAAIAQVAEDEGVVIGARGRSPGAIQKLEDGSVWKSEKIKPKNVNEVDVKWLGFKGQDLNEVRFRTYTPEQVSAITQRIEASSLSADEKAAVLERFQTRRQEEKYVSTIQGYSDKGQVNVGFRYRPNGIDRPSASAVRRFDLHSTPIGTEEGIPAGGTYYTPYQENPEYASLAQEGTLPPDCIRKLLAVLCTITGDIDGVYVTSPDGGPVPRAKLLKVYKRLQEIGWQHAETVTFVNDAGEFDFGVKTKILGGLEQNGGEAIYEWGPDGKRRATYLDLNGSKLTDSQHYYLHVVGGYTEKVARVP